jgi:hypothetical protein
MDDRKLNPLRLLIAVGCLMYFGWLSIQPSPPEAEPLVMQQPAPSAPAVAPAPAPVAQPIPCPGQIEQVAVGNYEVRLRITGAANTILVYTDQGNVTASTTEAGSAGEYRVRTPGPATAVQLDNCSPLNLR